MALIARALHVRRFVAAVVLGAVAFVTSPAWAEPRKSAEVRFAEGQDLFDTKRYERALPIFEGLLDETSSPNARLYVARCLRELGRLPEAYDHMKATVKDATARAATDPKYVETRDAAAAELALLEARVARVIVALVEGATAPAIKINGAPVAESELGEPRTVLPGKVFVEIERAGQASERRELQIPAGESRTIALGASAASTVVPAPEPTAEGGALRWIGVGVGVLGVGSFATFIGTAVRSDEIYADVEAACGGVRCADDSFGTQIDEGKTLETVATATAIIGGVLVAGAIPMIIFGGPTATEDSVRVSLGLHGAQLTWPLD